MRGLCLSPRVGGTGALMVQFEFQSVVCRSSSMVELQEKYGRAGRGLFGFLNRLEGLV